MDTITQIKSNIDSFSKQNFKFLKHIELLLLLKHIPDNIAKHLNDIDFIYHLNEASKHLKWIIDYMEANVNRNINREISKLKKNPDKMQEYADFTVDRPPVFKPREPRTQQLSFEDIMSKRIQETGKEIKPVKRRGDKQIAYKGNCACCGAPNSYLYHNDGKNQYKCKVCEDTFSVGVTPAESAGIYCPYCHCALDLRHERLNYNIYICNNKKCSHYRNNKQLRDDGKGEHLKTSSGQYLLHYHYRDFCFSMDDVRAFERDNTYDEAVRYKGYLSRIHADQKTLGLILAYYVNYGHSARKTTLMMKEIHGISISHQTVINYANIVAAVIKPMVDNYRYDLSDTLCGDETYIKVRGRNSYVFFWSDTTSRIITSYMIYRNRDTRAAVQSIHDCLVHYHGDVPDDLTLITDGNPIYNAAQLYFGINGISFDLHQVIGVRNKDEESRKYRPHKQREERLNRTYKANYYGTNGYDSLDGANSYMVLYVAFYNFLRVHSSLGYRTPVNDDLFGDDMFMQDRWLKLIDMSFDYHVQF